MLNNKLNLKLLNWLFVFLIILVIYQTKSMWFCILDFICNLLKPLIVSVVISYVCNLYLKKLNKIFNKFISIVLFVFTVLFIFYFLFFKLFPVIILQIIDCGNIVLQFLKSISVKFNINFVDLYSKLANFIDFLPNVSVVFNNVFKYFTFFCIVGICSIYLFFDFNKFVSKIKFLIKDNNNLFRFFVVLNDEMEKYVSSFFILVLLNIIEYILVFFVVGHPNYLLLGFMAGLFSLLPIFGGMFTNVVALITAFIFNYGLFIRTLIGILVLSILDGYVVSPIVYSHGVKLHPILVILSIYICNKLFGVFGIILAIPILIIINISFKWLKEKN